MATVSKRALYLGQGRGRARGNANSPKQPQVGKPSGSREKNENRNGTPSKELLDKVHMIKESAKRFADEKYEDDSSEDEEIEDSNIISSTLKIYTDTSQESISENTLDRTTQYLVDSCRPGANTCLICIASIKRLDAIWHCDQCFSIFHISCIQKWAIDGAVHHSTLSQENFPGLEASWFCPKCRHEFKQSECPTKYFCYCGKQQDPKFDPWIVPHSCGQTCGRQLKPVCGHECLLLCHPGPCPPCPKTIKTSCYCGKNGPSIRRCGSKEWSCGRPCNRRLTCGQHFCQVPCHAGECPPCSKESPQSCDCGKNSSMRPCASPQWQCQQVCGKRFACGFHICEMVCHVGSCGECPRSGERTCPCGKSKISLPCTEDVPTCGGTCNKELACGRHNCTQRCHIGPCGICRQFINKRCRCGKYEKNVQCCMEYLCESKCTNMRQCQRHLCKRKCCDNKCPSCEQICSRTLNCRNHKCSSPCHQGLCYPCPLTVKLSCFCGKTVITLPCGRERTTKPPKCNQLCKLSSNCSHPEQVPHRCHYGDCPPCKQPCGNVFKSCGHKCPVPCHDNVPVLNNIKHDAKKLQGARNHRQAETKVVQRLPCPPCQTLVQRKCFGNHESQSFPCHQAKQYSCGRSCGRQLSCGNHTCQLECHYVTNAPSLDEAGEECEVCEEPCSKPRINGCNHQCLLPCHPDDCPTCKQLIKKKCHCQLMTVYIQCSEWNSSDATKQEQLKSCKNQCPKTLECGHRCSSYCHSGPCPKQCNKKTSLKCPCKRKKKDFPCTTVRLGQASLECDKNCEDIKSKRSQKEEDEKNRKREEELRLQKEELELFERNRQGKKRRQKKQEADIIEDWWIKRHKKDLLYSAIAIAIVACLFHLAIT